MKKFWKWMEEKEYAKNMPIHESSKEKRLLMRYCSRVPSPNQMLIGYMIEYLIENKEYDNFIDSIYLVHLYDALGIDILYKDLKKKIEELNK